MFLGSVALPGADFFALLAPFCGNSAQVAFHQQLTTKIVLFQLRLIKVN
jgi:hypothetical protein